MDTKGFKVGDLVRVPHDKNYGKFPIQGYDFEIVGFQKGSQVLVKNVYKGHTGACTEGFLIDEQGNSNEFKPDQNDKYWFLIEHLEKIEDIPHSTLHTVDIYAKGLELGQDVTDFCSLTPIEGKRVIIAGFLDSKTTGNTKILLQNLKGGHNALTTVQTNIYDHRGIQITDPRKGQTGFFWTNVDYIIEQMNKVLASTKPVTTKVLKDTVEKSLSSIKIVKKKLLRVNQNN